MRRLFLALAGLAATGVLLSFAACVGDDFAGGSGVPDAGGSNPDAGMPGDAAGGDALSDASGGPDADADAALRRCDPSVPFSVVAAVSELNAGAVGAIDKEARLTLDELTIYWTSNRAGAKLAIHTASRAAKTSPFGNISAVPLTLGGGTDHATGPAVGADPNVLFFLDFSGVANSYAIAFETYAAPNWGSKTFEPAGALSLPYHVGIPYLTTDGLSLLFDGEASGDGGSHNVLFQSDRGATNGEFTDVSRTEIAELTTDNDNWQPALSADKLVIYFATDRATAGVSGDREIWHATRKSTADKFGAPVKDDSVNEAGTSCSPTWISPDLCTLYFSTNSSNEEHLVKGVRQPPP